MMAKMRKANRIIEVKDSQVDGYLKRGYDEIDKKGKVVTHATGGKTVPLADYNKVLKELENVKGDSNTKELESEVAALKEENKEYEKEIERLEGILKKRQQSKK